MNKYDTLTDEQVDNACREMEVEKYIKENISQVAGLISHALDNCCPMDCPTCLWAEICIAREGQ